MNVSLEESRRSRRRRVDERIDVIDAMTDQSIGQLGNLSDSGLLLLSNTLLHDDCLYQLRFTLADRQGQRSPIEVGAHLLWQNNAAAPGQAWLGFRFLSIDDGAIDRLREWIDAPGATYA